MCDNLVVLAGGASSRMKMNISLDSLLSEDTKQQANQRSKGLISINDNGRPLIDYLLFNAKNAGYKNIYIVTGKDNALFKELYGDHNSQNTYRELSINFAIQYIRKGRVKPLGTADALSQVLIQYPELKTRTFTVCNSDNLYSEHVLRLLRECKIAANALISYDREALEFSEQRIAKFAVMSFDEQQYLMNIVEKPTFEQIQKLRDSKGKLRVSMNIFKFDGSMIGYYVKNCPINCDRDEKELPTALLNMVKNNPRSVIGIPVSEHVPDLTTKEDILMVKDYVKNMNISDW